MKKFIFAVTIIFLFPLTTFAYSSVVMDVDSGRVLYEKNPNEKNLIASTTKVMTCIIVLENSDINNEITIGEEILDMVGTNIYISVGEKMKIEDLLYGLMLRSGNDAAQTLAVNTLGYDKFIAKMNEKAKDLKMNNTIFSNPHGLDDDTMNYSTAHDMALLSRYAYQNKTYRKIISTKKYTTKSSLKSYVWYNRMSLINQYKKCIGGKNGYTPKAGKSLVSYAKNEDLTLTIVSLDDSEIYENHKNMYNIYFSKYKNYNIVDSGNISFPDSFNQGKLYIKDSFKYPLLENELDNISTLVKVDTPKKNNVTGEVIISLDNKEIGKVNIYLKEEKKLKDKSIFQKLKELFIR